MKKIIITYNTCHYIFLFRVNLIRALQLNGYQVVAVAPEDKYSARLKELGVQFVPVNVDNKGLNPIKDLFLLIDFVRVFKRVNPEVILNFTIKPNLYGSIAASYLGIPVVANVTGLGTAFLRGGLIKLIAKLLYASAFRNVGMVFFQNFYDHEQFLRWGHVSATNSDLLPGSGVDISKFSPDCAPRLNGMFRFLLIARMIRDKGIVEYAEAVRLLKAYGVDFEACLLGQVDVENRGSISREVIKQWERDGLISYLGEVNDVRSEIGAADCVVLPSYREGTSKTLLEAASMALPLIATDVPGCNNVVIDGENGYLCEARNASSLAECMKRMMDLDVKARIEMGRRGRERMINFFDEKIVVDKYIEAIHRLTN